ncbi:MAG: type II toxin-antitoxin system RelE/ParE family toxin [Alphaproteobacteria bacterium]|nr:type II toxin-antitoxin system RelE/ParE family toxin [Alphaproteobacteria bacterium]
MRVKLTLAAQRDFTAQIDWLSARSSSAGRRATLAIVDALDVLRAYPDSGTAVEIEFREKYVRFGQYGYVIEYERHGSVVFVTRIYHGAQDRSRL